MPLIFGIRSLFADLDNFRENLIDLMQKVIVRLKETQPDNSQLFKLTIQILELAMFNDYSYESGKHFYNKIYTPLNENPTLYPPSVLHFKLDVYHWNMIHLLTNWYTNTYTKSHAIAVELLFDLSTSSLTQVRIAAQKILFAVMHVFPRVFDIILPKVMENLTKYEENYDLFKGTLYVLNGSNYDTLLLSGDWNWILKLWPALVQVNYAEKSKIATLFDNLPLFTDNYYTVPIEKNCISKQLAGLFQQAQLANFGVPLAANIKRIEDEIVKHNKMNREVYGQLVHQLVAILDPHKL